MLHAASGLGAAYGSTEGLLWTLSETFSATTANYAVRWFAASNFPGRETYAWITLALATAFILAIAARSVVAAIAGNTKRRNNAPALV